MLHLITGGTRSGKSSFAHDRALDLSDSPLYIATSRVLDEEMKERVAHHQKDRDTRFFCIEEDVNISQVEMEGRVVVLDCVTLWLVNLFMDNEQDLDKTMEFAKKQVDALLYKNATILIISNEMGMGVIGDTPFTRKFVDLHGWVNQYIAQKAEKMTVMFSGMPLHLK